MGKLWVSFVSNSNKMVYFRSFFKSCFTSEKLFKDIEMHSLSFFSLHAFIAIKPEQKK